MYASGSTYATRFERSAVQQAGRRGLRLVPVSVPVGPEQVRATLRAALRDPENPRALLIHNDAAVAMLPFVLPFTSVESAPVAVAQTAVEMLGKRIASPGGPVRQHLIVPHLNPRASVETLAD